jgi:hypothetical protein
VEVYLPLSRLLNLHVAATRVLALPHRKPRSGGDFRRSACPGS